MRCVRDHISIENFAKKIMQFLHITDTSFSILTHDKSPTKSLWNGPNLYTVFMNRLRHKIAKVIKWTQITDLQKMHTLSATFTYKGNKYPSDWRGIIKIPSFVSGVTHKFCCKQEMPISVINPFYDLDEFIFISN